MKLLVLALEDSHVERLGFEAEVKDACGQLMPKEVLLDQLLVAVLIAVRDDVGLVKLKGVK